MPEIIAKLGMDQSRFDKGLASAERNWLGFTRKINSQARAAAEDIGKGFEKNFGARDMFRSFGAVIGLDASKIATSIARAITGLTEEAEQAYARIVAAGERTTNALRGQLEGRRTEAEQIAAIHAEDRRESRAGGMKEQSRAQRVLSRIPLIGPFVKEEQESRGVFSAEEIMAAKAEENAAGQERASRITALRSSARQKAHAEFTSQFNESIEEKPIRGQIALMRKRSEMLAKEARDRKNAMTVPEREGFEKEARELRINARRKELDLERDIERKAAEEQKKRSVERQAQLEKEARARDAYLTRYRTYLEALDDVASGKRDLQDAKHDALAFTVAEAADGARGNSADRARAREIQRNEQRARRLFDSGATVTEFDRRTQRNIQLTGSDFMERANTLRKGFGKLTTGEQNTMASLEKRLDETNKHLAAMERALMPTKMGR